MFFTIFTSLSVFSNDKNRSWLSIFFGGSIIGLKNDKKKYKKYEINEMKYERGMRKRYQYHFWIIIKHSKKIRIKVKIFSIHCNKNENKNENRNRNKTKTKNLENSAQYLFTVPENNGSVVISVF